MNVDPALPVLHRQRATNLSLKPDRGNDAAGIFMLLYS